MSIKNDPPVEGDAATYLRSGDPARRFTGYYPPWLDNLADDVTVEGSMLDGVVQGADAVRTVLGAVRSQYEVQEFNFAGTPIAGHFAEGGD